MKTLILVRHGETEVDKARDRVLTNSGKEHVNEVAVMMKNYCKGKIVVCYSKTFRAKQTAEIIGKVLDSKRLYENEFRIKNADNIRDLIKRNEINNIRPAQTYLELGNCAKWKIESPKDLYSRWLNILNTLIEETVIVVSHEGSLEAFIYNQRSFELVYKSFSGRYFGYSDFVVLKLKK